ncbi:MAG: hypothetical protein ACI9LO_001254 [Planctomycetota bacterium]|jgi:hypothetical protein
MQLKKKKIAGLLSAATCSLLAGNAAALEHEWDIDSALMIYNESGGRISAIEPVISGKKDLGDDEILSFKLVLDVLIGASATGSVPSTQPQTFTRPSGIGSYTVAANETPLDDTFQDTRISFSQSWDKPIDSNNRRTLGYNLSREYDFTSISGNALWQHDINQKNTSFTTGINVELDALEPVGGAPVPLTTLNGQAKQGSKSRDIIDLLFGVTQIIDQSSLFQVNLSFSEANGYLTDPYKYVSVVDTNGLPTSQLFERRPESRSRQSIYAKYKNQLANKDIVTTSYRLMSDDWGVDSSTFDLTYRFKLKNGNYIQPHVRLYQQSATDFYRYFLLDSEAVPEFASADYRLGELDGNTIGVKFGKDVDNQQAWSARIEFYRQSGKSSPDEAIGQLTQQDLFPDVDAVIIQFNYSLQW